MVDWDDLLHVSLIQCQPLIILAMAMAYVMNTVYLGSTYKTVIK